MRKKMPTPDVALEDFFADNEKFADLFSSYMKNGIVIDPAKLETIAPVYKETLKAADGATKLVRYRDIVRRSELGTCFVILAVENQTMVHYAMPLRVMLYDAMGYTAECKEIGMNQGFKGKKWTVDEFLSRMEKETRLNPIFTIVLYTGEKPWDGPRTLHDMLKMTEELRDIIPDYPLHVIDLGHDRIEFQTKGLKELSNVLQILYNEDIEKSRVKVSGAILSLAGILSGSEELYQRAISAEGSEVVMCEAIKKVVERGRNEGRSEGICVGKLQQLYELAADGLLSLEVAAQKAGVPIAAFKQDMVGYMENRI